MPTKKKTSAATKPANARGTATPNGASFWGTFQTCKYLWFLVYELGIVPLKEEEYFRLGSAYHAFLYGKTEQQVRAEYPDVADEALRLYKERTKPGRPAIPSATRKEELRFAPAPVGKIFTSQPDQDEIGDDGKPSVRDYKTAAWLKDSAQDQWQTSLSMIGEMVCAGVQTATMDIISKTDSPVVRTLKLRLQDQHVRAFEKYLTDAYRDLIGRYRLFEADAKKNPKIPRASIAETHFPRNIATGCVNATTGKKCTHYAYCWDGPLAQRNYKHVQIDEWKANLLGGRNG